MIHQIKNNSMADKIAKKKDMVKVYGTGVSAKFLPQGKEVTVHQVAAENLVRKGYAQFEKIEAESKSTRGKATEGKVADKK
jgi:hypothetical protein